MIFSPLIPIHSALIIQFNQEDSQMSIINNTNKREFHSFLALKPVSYSESRLMVALMMYPSNIG